MFSLSLEGKRLDGSESTGFTNHPQVNSSSNSSTNESAIVSSNKIKRNLGELKNERLIRMNVEQQLINLKDDRRTETDSGEQVNSTKLSEQNDDQFGNRISNHLKSQDAFDLPVANSTNAVQATYRNDRFKQLQVANYLSDRFDRIVSASFIWRNQIHSHIEQKHFASVFVSVYLLFVLTWLAFSFTILTTQLCTFDWQFDRTGSNGLDWLIGLQRAANETSNSNDDDSNFHSTNHTVGSTLDHTNSSTIGHSNSSTISHTNSSRTNSSTIGHSNSSRTTDDRTRRSEDSSKALLNKLNELDFGLINRLWYLTLVFSAFSPFIFPILDRQWLFEFIHRQSCNFVQFIKTH